MALSLLPRPTSITLDVRPFALPAKTSSDIVFRATRPEIVASYTPPSWFDLVGPAPSIHSASAAAALEAIRSLYAGLSSADERIRAACARDLAYTYSRLPPAPAGREATPEERGIELRRLLSNPNAELQAALDDTGWVRRE